MKFTNNNDGASALEKSATPSPCLGAHIGMILPVFLRILILFAIVLVFLQTMIDQNSFDTEAEDQNISIHAGHPALRQSRKMSSGTALKRFPYDSIENRRNDLFSTTFWDSSIHQEPVPASPRPSSRNERGENLPPANNESKLSAPTASAGCSSKFASAS